MPKLETTATVTTTQTVKLKPLLARKLRVELKAYTELKAQYDTLKSALDKRKATLGGLREATGEQSLSFEGYRLTKVEGTSSKLDKKKLVELGCALAWLEEATVTTPKKPYELITLPGEKPEAF